MARSRVVILVLSLVILNSAGLMVGSNENKSISVLFGKVKRGLNSLAELDYLRG